MITAINKKYIGLGFIALLTIFILNTIVAIIPLEPENSLFIARNWYFMLSNLLKIAIVLYIAFYPKCVSTLISKIGSTLYGLLNLIYITNFIFSKFEAESPLYSSGISEYIYSLCLFAPGFLLLTWGSRVWLPVKILLSIDVLLNVIADMLWIKLISIYQNSSGTLDFDKIDPLQNTISILSCISTFVIIGALVTTIIWLSIKTKTPSATTQKIDLI